ncbi:hypothetical protein Kpho01_39950 [Kitasatospora phosalacinea]|uniref:Uncharacterized protein n=1 Tax=Kitasatospora phosalacinea TaxID=2065 RepID=A0A9W6PJD0_9ACTN|nr:hypothetical protein Kpho01_39950 [Kitasatospora phosalacinea]
MGVFGVCGRASAAVARPHCGASGERANCHPAAADTAPDLPDAVAGWRLAAPAARPTRAGRAAGAPWWSWNPRRRGPKAVEVVRVGDDPRVCGGGRRGRRVRSGRPLPGAQHPGSAGPLRVRAHGPRTGARRRNGPQAAGGGSSITTLPKAAPEA